MTAFDQVLSRHGLDPDDEDLAKDVETLLIRVPAVSAAPISTDAAAYLAQHGGALARTTVDQFDPVQVRRDQTTAAVSAAVTLHVDTLDRREMAGAIGVSPTRVTHLTREAKVLSVRLGRTPSYPRWQVSGGRLLPGLPAVIAAVPAGLHPMDLAGFMRTPQDELNGRTPIGHLIDGGDPADVAALLAVSDRW